MIKIKIHDTQWLKEHCNAVIGDDLKPKGECWKHATTVHWLSGLGGMGSLEGKVLMVEADSGVRSGDITDARYIAEGFWIPNWAIEWVMEERE